jgi:hypothetical protein
MRAVVPFRPVLPVAAPRRPSRIITGHRFAGLGATSVGPPVGAGSGAGAEIGASQGASIGTAIVPGIGTAIGLVVGAIGGAIAGAINKTDPENVDFNDAVAIWQQNPNAVYSIGNPYLALAGLFDLNLTTNVPIYKKFGHMGEAAFVVWLCNLVYQAAQAGQITANDTALTVMSKVVQPAINAWGYGAMSDPHADLINRLIVTLILQYTAGLQGNWYAVGGDYPTQFNSIPPFSLPAAAAQSSAPTQPAASAAPSGAQVMPVGAAQANMPSRPVSGSFTNGANITPTSGTYIGDGAGEWYFGPDIVATSTDSDGNAFYLYTNQPTWVNASGVQAEVVNGQVYLQSHDGRWWTYNGYTWSTVSAPPATVANTTNEAATASATPQPPVAPTNIESADGSKITAPGTAFETPLGGLLYLGPQASGDPDNQYGYPVWDNGTHNGYLAGMILLNGGQIYGVTSTGGWFQWVNNNWTTISGPPTTTTAATTSTVASQQATQACTPSTTGGGSAATTGVTSSPSGGVVGTTTNGDPITDSDIQDLIDQMSSSSSTAEQTYDAVIQALQDQGASVTTGLQNQVAAQVQNSAPASGTVAASSNTGLYLVGGGLALLGVLYFMRRRSP